MALQICRLCLGKAERPHYTVIFSENSQSKNVPERLSSLSGVPISHGDGLPGRVCRTCMDKFSSLEKSLAKFQEMAKSSWQNLSRKRTKETSGNIGVSPHTERARPPAKRSRTRLLFSDNSSKSKCNNQ